MSVNKLKIRLAVLIGIFVFFALLVQLINLDSPLLSWKGLLLGPFMHALAQPPGSWLLLALINLVILLPAVFSDNRWIRMPSFIFGMLAWLVFGLYGVGLQGIN